MEDLVYGLGLISRDFVPKLVHTRETEIAVLTRLAVDVKPLITISVYPALRNTAQSCKTLSEKLLRCQTIDRRNNGVTLMPLSSR
jgi:hypothetical protein